MDFSTTDEQQALAEAVRGTLRRHASQTTGREESAAPPAHDETLWSSLVETGVPGLLWSEEDGGLGAGMTDLAAAATAVGRAGVQVPLAECVVAGALVRALAPADVRREILGDLTEGSALPIPALAEPLRAWSPVPTDVTASEGTDSWTLSGTKAPVRYAPAATHLLVSAATESGTGVFLLPSSGGTGEELVLDSSPATLLAQGPSADTALREALALGGVVLCAEAVGVMQEALRLTTEYLGTRTQFGRTLASFQALTHRAADMYAQLELARSTTLYAAMAADERPLDVDHVLRARVVVDGAARLIGQEAIQMHGGIGVTAEHAVGHLTARLTALTRTWGDRRSHLAELATRIDDHEGVEVLV
ncbi:acyl-CoA dehydrogenase family protein [Janibacter sp. DB-40]|uniref:acyl-CoA dehydrogenase family protein n=1 Tax=Janibacter sp. DB-40 TaxID=3028808 RepID=UPI002404A28E|nr:acyl-CoA dehydrogenase family protein [Janibacter sp. DB-40]